MQTGQTPGERGTRRSFLELALATLAAPVIAPWNSAALAQSDDDDILSRNAVLRDPGIPALTAPNGDLTIVEYFDYQCPYCRKVYPELMNIVQADGKIRLIVKDWPILGDDSIYAARMSLAARYQDKYPEAHEALITAPRRLTRQITDDRLAGIGIDINRANVDLKSHRQDIDSLLARNDQQARALRFQGIPAFIVGTFRLPGALDSVGFRQIIADARALAAKDK
ncbi:MAG: thioredoxin domain-containing protein [Rhizobiales bacterium]|nr:thioredoxin domain-containing protein [Hyphomicrobiales bacterium]